MKVELTPEKLKKLKNNAEEANYNPYFRENRHSLVKWSKDADPATVLAMVDEIEQLRRMERKWGQMLRNVKDTAPDLETFLSPDAFKINESEAGQ